MGNKIDSFLIEAIKASLVAGEAIMEIYDSNSFEVDHKSDDSPLTQADIASNAKIIAALSPTEVPIISEEIANLPYAERKDWESCWIVDPLDGTKEFIKRNGEFTVNIALLDKGKLSIGVIYVPVHRQLYFTQPDMKKAYGLVWEDQECTLSNLMEQAEPLVPRKDSKILKVIGSKSHMNELTRDYVDGLAMQDDRPLDIVAVGSSLKFCEVAAGKAEIYPRFGPTMEWDTAAGQAICEAAGLDVIQADTGVPLQYNKEDLYNPYFIVK
ncbi:3'(2'),5'-bisphosphate nucleotidase CysQ [Nonlabens xiamenensis]|uniref:3'(2'),5'-bisphosphate nucleotidase CysQ n=1 Tax=Nonlabens xiamenensis TaxID=2341043 RepID=UPI000F60A9EF|nr:3'(2'),5'-bisphosphate nucleotidase CysQ [Nonlabens xiamenensis]